MLTLDFEEALAVKQKEETTWEGSKPLGLPIAGARGVYGGHMIAQALLVAIELAPEYIPHSFHSHFIRAGSPTVSLIYKVSKLGEGEFTKRQVFALQNGHIVLSAMCSLRKKGCVRLGPVETRSTRDNREAEILREDDSYLDARMHLSETMRPNGSETNYLKVDFQPPVPRLVRKYPNPDALNTVVHTDFVHSAYLEEFVSHELCPEEKDLLPSERWITLWTRLNQDTPFSHPKFNFVGLAELSDSSILTTLVRALHLNCNATQDNPFQTFDELKDLRNVLDVSLNILHIFHYNAMSMDHSLYFHVDDFCDLNVLRWMTMTHNYKISKNNRTLVRGHYFDSDGKCVASFVQEGLTYMNPGVTQSKF